MQVGDPPVGGRYALVAPFGADERFAGGKVRTWRARDTLAERDVVLRVLAPGGNSARLFLDRALEMSMIAHPSLGMVYEAVDHGEYAIVVSEWIDGTSLADTLAAHGPLSPTTARQTIGDVADAITEAHHAGLPIGGITAERVFLRDNAAVTVAGVPALFADERGDIQQLGRLLYAALTGQQTDLDDPDVARRIPRGVPRDLAVLCQRALDRDPSRQLGSAAAFATVLRPRTRSQSPAGATAGRTGERVGGLDPDSDTPTRDTAPTLRSTSAPSAPRAAPVPAPPTVPVPQQDAPAAAHRPGGGAGPPEPDRRESAAIADNADRGRAVNGTAEPTRAAGTTAHAGTTANNGTTANAGPATADADRTTSRIPVGATPSDADETTRGAPLTADARSAASRQSTQSAASRPSTLSESAARTTPSASSIPSVSSAPAAAAAATASPTSAPSTPSAPPTPSPPAPPSPPSAPSTVAIPSGRADGAASAGAAAAAPSKTSRSGRARDLFQRPAKSEGAPASQLSSDSGSFPIHYADDDDDAWLDDSGTWGSYDDEDDPETGGPYEGSQTRRKVLIYAVPVVALILVVLLGVFVGQQFSAVIAGSDDDSPLLPTSAGSAPTSPETVGSEATESTEAPAAPVPLPPVGAAVYDPFGDGQPENDDEVGLSYDGDVGSAWPTLTYQGTPELGNLKPGVGIIFDLGAEKTINSVELATNLPGGAVEVRVGAAPDAPLESYSVVGALDPFAESGSVALAEPVRARFVIIWFIRLVDSNGGFRGALAECRILGT
ncbi:MAG: hypothetical protein M3381_07440 [Actinomycetota bacterium]|nr:hypothetical protein [Actinomycetota bacterium]